MAYHGKFRPVNSHKYIGDIENIIWRSSWELRVLKYLDSCPNVISYASEEIKIPYQNPIKGTWHRYFPDFYVKWRKADGTIHHMIWEIKPDIQTRPPVKKSKITRRFVIDTIKYRVNQAKWDAAKTFVEENGWKFMVITEKMMNLKM